LGPLVRQAWLARQVPQVLVSQVRLVPQELLVQQARQELLVPQEQAAINVLRTLDQATT
jgi:hypothetical protein